MIESRLISVRYHQDHRRKGWWDVFPPEIKSVNCVVIPQANTIAAWHRHLYQKDYWFCPQGLLQVGVALTEDGPENIKELSWYFLSPESREVLEIPENHWHGYKSLEPYTILIYGMTNIWNGTDEERMTLQDAGVNWNLGVK